MSFDIKSVVTHFSLFVGVVGVITVLEDELPVVRAGSLWYLACICVFGFFARSVHLTYRNFLLLSKLSKCIKKQADISQIHQHILP